jgi:hypothetical protein
VRRDLIERQLRGEPRLLPRAELAVALAAGIRREEIGALHRFPRQLERGTRPAPRERAKLADRRGERLVAPSQRILA